MKPLTIFLTFCTITLAVSSLTAFAGQTKTEFSELTLHITGFENSTGIARVALVNSKENYAQDTPFKGYNFDITNKNVLQTIQLPYGEYAIKVFHDKNSNNELDTLIFGIPKERYGFSNNARETFGPPEYKDAVFNLDSPKKEINIIIK